MPRIIAAKRLADALKEAGYPLPNNCAEVRMVIKPTGAIMIQYDVYATDEILGQLGRALQSLTVEIKEE